MLRARSQLPVGGGRNNATGLQLVLPSNAVHQPSLNAPLEHLIQYHVSFYQPASQSTASIVSRTTAPLQSLLRGIQQSQRNQASLVQDKNATVHFIKFVHSQQHLANDLSQGEIVKNLCSMIEYVQACRAKICSSYESLCSTSEQVVLNLKSLIEKRENYAMLFSEIAQKQALSSLLINKAERAGCKADEFDQLEEEKMKQLQIAVADAEILYEERRCKIQESMLSIL